MNHAKRSVSAAMVCTVVALVCTSLSVLGDPGIRSAWMSRYGSVSSSMNNLSTSCNLCHATGGGEPWNAYGWNLRQQIYAGFQLSQAFTNIEGMDSDNDPNGSTNLEEILASTQPGWTTGPNNTFFYLKSTVLNQMPALCSGEYDPPMQCVADVNGSGAVDVDDLIAVILGWGPCPTPPSPCPADINDSGFVDVDDLIAVILGWGACP